MKDVTQQNRRAWNEIAEVRGRRWEEKYPAEFYTSGGCTLSTEVLEAAGAVVGRRVLHLQCATGEDTLSWAVKGAQATGVDISDAQIEIARRKATAANLEVNFVAADVLALPGDLGQFDVVYTGGGALIWIPDIDHWATEVAACVRPGGSLIIEEEHPLAETLVVQDGTVRMEGDYFHRGRVELSEPGWPHFDDKGKGTEAKYEFIWPLGDVVTALSMAGLRVRSLREYPVGDEARWRFGSALEEARQFPGRYVLVAARES